MPPTLLVQIILKIARIGKSHICKKSTLTIYKIIKFYLYIKYIAIFQISFATDVIFIIIKFWFENQNYKPPTGWPSSFNSLVLIVTIPPYPYFEYNTLC